MDEFIESWSDEDAKRWGRIIVESIRRQHGENAEVALNDPEVILQTAAITCSTMLDAIKSQGAGMLAQVDQISAHLRDKK